MNFRGTQIEAIPHFYPASHAGGGRGLRPHGHVKECLNVCPVTDYRRAQLADLPVARLVQGHELIAHEDQDLLLRAWVRARGQELHDLLLHVTHARRAGPPASAQGVLDLLSQG